MEYLVPATDERDIYASAVKTNLCFRVPNLIYIIVLLSTDIQSRTWICSIITLWLAVVCGYNFLACGRTHCLLSVGYYMIGASMTCLYGWDYFPTQYAPLFSPYQTFRLGWIGAYLGVFLGSFILSLVIDLFFGTYSALQHDYTVQKKTQ